MTHKVKRREAILIPLIGWFIGCILLFLVLYPLGRLFEGKLYQAVDEGARQYKVDGEYLMTSSTSMVESESEADQPSVGSSYARLIQQDISLDAPIYYGDSEEYLQKGLGQYINHIFPGMPGVLLISGHDDTYLRHIEQIKVGQFITIQINEKKFYYIITRTAIEDADHLSSFIFDSKEQELVLYTCYPIGDLTKNRNQRYIIYGKRYIK